MRVVVEGMYARPEAPRRQTEQAAAGTSVDERSASEARDAEHFAQRLDRVAHAFLGQTGEKSRPVLAEFKAVATRHFPGVCALPLAIDYRIHILVPQRTSARMLRDLPTSH